MKEFELLNVFKQIKGDSSVKIGPGDDTAVIKSGKKYLLLCSDMLIEDSHFRLPETKFTDIGYAAVARPLSDIAAMGGIPKHIGVSLGIPPKYSNYIPKILSGVKKITHQFKINLIGGDVSKASKIFLDTWCLGETIRNRYATRKNAKDKDGIFVTNKLGDLKNKELKLFTPRIKEGQYLVKNHKINSMIDISDGLVMDLYRILTESKKSAVLFKDKIPVGKKCTLNQALYGGENYGLLFTTSIKNAPRLKTKGFYQIGIISNKKKTGIIEIEDKNKRKTLKIKGYTSL